jgi:hypothetical protein
MRTSEEYPPLHTVVCVGCSNYHSALKSPTHCSRRKRRRKKRKERKKERKKGEAEKVKERKSLEGKRKAGALIYYADIRQSKKKKKRERKKEKIERTERKVKKYPVS